METPLDSAAQWFLESLRYSEGVLEVQVAEGITHSEPEPLEIQGVQLGPVHRVEPTPASRRYIVRFEDVHAYELVLESYVRADKYGESDAHKLSVFVRSEYLDHIRATTLLDIVVNRPYQHFGLFLTDEVVNVICRRTPTVSATARSGA